MASTGVRTDTDQPDNVLRSPRASQTSRKSNHAVSNVSLKNFNTETIWQTLTEDVCSVGTCDYSRSRPGSPTSYVPTEPVPDLR